MEEIPRVVESVMTVFTILVTSLAASAIASETPFRQYLRFCAGTECKPQQEDS
jgi:hypothetical protein